MNNDTQLRTYIAKDCAVFRVTKEQYGGLSNMAGGFPLRVNGTTIWSSEALYQACRFPDRQDVQESILAERSPMTAKMKSKPYRKEYSRPDWENVKVKVMKWCLRIKLAQNWERFGELLRSTEDRPIVEESRKDDFWGAKRLEDGTLVGMNVLGRLLMGLRQELASNNSYRLKFVSPLDIPNFLLLGRPICEIKSQTKSVRTAPEPAISRNTLVNLSNEDRRVVVDDQAFLWPE
ncbi:MAG TPA: NADAR family protein [Acidobacteriaceae bacterium]|nr:NADAR family protein [Acidobacteriaceae bacterium]